MKRIDKIIFNNNNIFQLENNWSDYISPKVMKIVGGKELTLNISVDTHKQQQLVNVIQTCIEELLGNYQPPSQSEVQKHASRFEKVKVNDKVYRINYRQSENGRMIFALYSLILLIQEAIQLDSNIQITLLS